MKTVYKVTSRDEEFKETVYYAKSLIEAQKVYNRNTYGVAVKLEKIVLFEDKINEPAH